MKKFRGINPFKVHFNFDTDRDGIIDFRDCRPFDYRRQHIGPAHVKYQKKFDETEKEQMERIFSDVNSRASKKADSLSSSPYSYFFRTAQTIMDKFDSRPFMKYITDTKNKKRMKVEYIIVPFNKKIISIFDKDFDVIGYADITDRVKLLFLITPLDKEKLGESLFQKFLKYTYTNDLCVKKGKFRSVER